MASEVLYNGGSRDDADVDDDDDDDDGDGDDDDDDEDDDDSSEELKWLVGARATRTRS
jgi:hypothetical protein